MSLRILRERQNEHRALHSLHSSASSARSLRKTHSAFSVMDQKRAGAPMRTLRPLAPGNVASENQLDLVFRSYLNADDGNGGDVKKAKLLEMIDRLMVTSAPTHSVEMQVNDTKEESWDVMNEQNMVEMVDLVLSNDADLETPDVADEAIEGDL